MKNIKKVTFNMRTSLSFFHLLDRKVTYSSEEIQAYDGWLTITYDTSNGNYVVGIPGKQFESSSGQEKGEVTIKSNIQIDSRSYQCVGIADFCFYKTKIRKVLIPDTLQYIGNYAFYGCTLLNEIDLTGTNINSIGSYAFASCSNLATVLNIASESFSLGEFCFFSCSNLIEINIGGANLIPNYAFANCEALETLTLPNNVQSINETSFYNLPSLKEIIVKDQSTIHSANDLVINNHCLYYFNSEDDFELVKVPAQYSGELTIHHDTNSIVSIWKYAFQYCKSISGELILIPDQANDLASNVKLTLQSHTFVSCYSITNIQISKHIELIKYGTFIDFGTNFEGFTVASENEFYKTYENTGILVNFVNSEIISCPPNVEISDTLLQSITSLDTLCDYCFSNNQAVINSLDLSSFQSLNEGCFYSCQNLIGPVILNSKITSIPPYLFYNCISLESIQFSSLTEIGDYAFYGCVKFSFDGGIPDSVEYIGKYCFTNAQQFSDILILPSKLKEIKAHSFESTKITQIFIPDSVTIIEEYAFAQCTSLSGLLDSGFGTKTIQNNAFDDCNQIQTFVIHSTLTSVDFTIFNTLTSLSSIIIDGDHPLYKEYGKGIYSNNYKTIYKYPNGMSQSPILHNSCEIIAEYCFYGSSFSCGFTIPSTIKEIKEHAFENSKIQAISFTPAVSQSSSRISLSSDTFSSGYYSPSFFLTQSTASIEIIGDYAFANSQIGGLLEIPNSVQSIGDFAFNNCNKLTLISLGTNSNIGESAFTQLLATVLIYYYGEDNTTQISVFDDGTKIFVPTTYKANSFLGYTVEQTDQPYDTSSIGDIELCPTPPPAHEEEEEESDSPSSESPSESIASEDTAESSFTDFQSSSSTEIQSDDNNEGDGNSTLKIVGIVFLVVFIILIVVVVGFIIFYFRKKKKTKEDTAEVELEDMPKVVPITPETLPSVTGDVPTLVTRTNGTFDDFDSTSSSYD